jgi:hypothetical protein
MINRKIWMAPGPRGKTSAPPAFVSQPSRFQRSVHPAGSPTHFSFALMKKSGQSRALVAGSGRLRRAGLSLLRTAEYMPED